MLKHLLIVFVFYMNNLSFIQNLKGQQNLKFKLTDVINIANDSSLSAFKNNFLFLTNFDSYQSYLLQMRPTFNFTSNPLNFNRSLSQRYNSVLSVDEYVPQQSISSNAGVSINQKIFFTGGTLSLNSELDRIQNFGEYKNTQYSSVPVSINYSQSLLGFNQLKWQHKIEPIKYEKAKMDYLKSCESTTLEAVGYFFDFVTSKINEEIAQTNLSNADTFYNIGLKRMEMASISSSDLLALKINYLNAKNNLVESNQQVDKAKFNFCSFLRVSDSIPFELILPENLPLFQVNFEDVLQKAQNNNPDFIGNRQQLLEALSNLEEAKRNQYLNISLSLGYGLNQQNELLYLAYHKPQDRQSISISISYPIFNWGQFGRKYKIAKSNMRLTNATIEKAEYDIKNNISMLVTNFNLQNDFVKRANEVQNLAKQAYEISKQRFLLGKIDVNSLSIARSTKDQAINDYLNSLRAYWQYYYNLRMLTLFDFESGKSLSKNFDELLEVK